MHSRIIELSKDPILKHERMCESSVSDWFYHSIADYGVVSSSGFGDGSYVCYTHKGSDGEIDFAFVIFIDE